ncbi:MAG: cobalt transporter, partial [Nocardioidaceae bacterium]
WTGPSAVAISFWLPTCVVIEATRDLAVTAAWPGSSWVDPTIALGIAAWSIREGVAAWHGEECC